jgi:putative colanic acid biosysnthesis UDP-glucose lipid carrier transferase
MHTKETKIRFTFLFLDLIILNAIILFWGWVRFDVVLRDTHQSSFYLLMGNLALLSTYLIFVRNNLYLRDTFTSRFTIITQRSLIFALILSSMGILFLPQQYSYSFLLQCVGFFYLGKLIFYRLLYSVLRYRRKKGLHTNRVLIVGENETTYYLRKLIDTNPMLGYRFIGYVSDHSENPDCLGTTDQLSKLIKKHHIQMVFVSNSLLSDQFQGNGFLTICSSMSIQLRFVSENHQQRHSHRIEESLSGITLANPMELPLDEWKLRAWKRLADLLISMSAILFIFSWLFPIIAILIKLNSKGPVFFVQKRTGFNKKTFNCIKFRSMNVNNQANCLQAKPNDNRITSFGRFLRKTNLDQLPQFLNVFLGQMSVVGPRPHMLRHTALYSGLIDHYVFRYYVKPGVTGWAQINGYRGETNELWKMQKRVEYDLEYIENWNFWWDISIIWKTIFSINAYENARRNEQFGNQTGAAKNAVSSTTSL